MRMKRGFRKIEKRESMEEKKGGGAIRMRFLVFFVSVGALLIGLKLYSVQVVNHGIWEAAAAGQYFGERDIRAERGEIFFSDGKDGRYPVAVNRDEPLLYAVPNDVEDPVVAAHAIADILGIDAGTLQEKLSKRDDPYEMLKRRLSQDEADRIRNLNISGLHFASETNRYYPAGEFAAQVIGFVGPKSDGTEGEEGKYGVEAAFEEGLKGISGRVKEERDAGGRWISLTDREFVPAKNGDSYVLTIDRNMQFEAERILHESIELYAAESGSMVVMDPKTGAIRAMATVPQFDPNRYREVEDYSVFLNPVTSAAYESGSVMKPFTMAMGLEEGKVNPNTEYVDTGVVNEAGFKIRNAEDKVYGRSSMTKVLDESINTGVIFVERLVGHEKFREYLRNFGFNEKAGFGFPAEVYGNMKNLSNARRNIEFYTASFGQGITVTPLQIARAYAVFANEGVLVRPRLIETVIHSDGTEETFRAEEVRRVLAPETARMMGEMLRSVVVNGHGKYANVPGYLVVGKTGTAQVAKKNEKGYDEALSVGSFAGYAPLNDPKFVIAVKLDHPKNVEWAESSAAPVFGKMMKFLLDYEGVEPTEPLKKNQE